MGSAQFWLVHASMLMRKTWEFCVILTSYLSETFRFVEFFDSLLGSCFFTAILLADTKDFSMVLKR